MYCILCSVYWSLCTVYYILCTVYRVLCTVFCVLITVYCILILCTVYRVLCTNYCVLYTVQCVKCVTCIPEWWVSKLWPLRPEKEQKLVPPLATQLPQLWVGTWTNRFLWTYFNLNISSSDLPFIERHVRFPTLPLHAFSDQWWIKYSMYIIFKTDYFQLWFLYKSYNKKCGNYKSLILCKLK